MKFTFQDTVENWTNTVDDCSNVLLSQTVNSDGTETRVYGMGAPLGQFTAAWYRPNPDSGSAPNINHLTIGLDLPNGPALPTPGCTATIPEVDHSANDAAANTAANTAAGFVSAANTYRQQA